ncbi:uncharacterized protein LOC131156728 [Malania oleifera]|uniref:uncharacterized protein LOC131156728 n=1 Tax=Malania oleifera TaxID=397392 RepID=UPI0025ADCDAB|nr:uncharacterized protein LOC131156728 [Malania oleifera]XP_057966603.1 uncharacterized protein LOC131156728 [Malania oleifera]
MVQLFLSRPMWGDSGEEDDSFEPRISLLNKLESVLWLLILSSGSRSEARLWLCNTISGIRSIAPRHQLELFVTLLRTKKLKGRLATQLLQMFFEKRPHKAGSVLAKKSYMLEDFFRGNSRRISQWFSNFCSVGGGLEVRKGAKAISQFAFVNRDICWEELEWKGKHGQSPAMVATKPHYFLDLDVQRTVNNFIENVPEFWSSNEFAESLKDGEILSTDINFFVDFFVDLMYKEDSKEIWEVINEFLEEESFSSLCHHSLIVLQEEDICIFLQLIKKYLNPRMEPKDFDNPSCWLEIVLSRCNDCASIDQLLFLNAVINQGRQLMRLLSDEEAQEEKAQIKGIVLRICTTSNNSNSLAPIVKEWLKTKTIKVIKWLGLQSWVLHYILLEECQTPASWESLFVDNGIGFEKSEEYALLHHDGFSEEIGSDLEDGASVRSKRKKKGKTRKKRRRTFGSYDDELLDPDMSTSRRQSRAGSWFLSTDEYSTLWNSADLPDHLSKHCLSTWMKWLFPLE